MAGDGQIWRSEAVARLAAVDGHVVLVVGESGSGKSHVLEQALIARLKPYGIRRSGGAMLSRFIFSARQIDVPSRPR